MSDTKCKICNTVHSPGAAMVAYAIMPAHGRLATDWGDKTECGLTAMIDEEAVAPVLAQRNALWDALSDILEQPGTNIPDDLRNWAVKIIEEVLNTNAGNPPPRPIVIVTVEGGCVRGLHSNIHEDHIEVIVRDFDSQSERQVSTQSYPVDPLTDKLLAEIRAEIEQTDREMEEEMKA